VLGVTEPGRVRDHYQVGDAATHAVGYPSMQAVAVRLRGVINPEPISPAGMTSGLARHFVDTTLRSS